MRATKRSTSTRSSGSSGSSPAASRTALSMAAPCTLVRAAARAENASVPSSSPSQAARPGISSALSARTRRSSPAMPSSASISSDMVSACCARERNRLVRPPQRQVFASTWATASKSTSAASSCSGSPGHGGGGPPIFGERLRRRLTGVSCSVIVLSVQCRCSVAVAALHTLQVSLYFVSPCAGARHPGAAPGIASAEPDAATDEGSAARAPPDAATILRPVAAAGAGAALGAVAA